MSSQDLHQVILRWPHVDANEVKVTGTFDSWSSSLHLTRKPDGFEAPPVFIPWRSKIAYKFIVDGRWMTNDAEPTEVDHGFVNNVYTAPAKPVLPEPEPSAPPSYHSEMEVETEPAEKVADEPTTNGTALLPEIHETPATPIVEAAVLEQQPLGPDNESEATTVTVAPAIDAVRETVAPVVEEAQAAVAQVAPAPIEVEKAAHEITSVAEVPNGSSAPVAPEPIQIAVPELAPKVPIGILPNSTLGGSSEDATPAAVQVDSEHERSTHVPLRFGSGTATPEVKEVVPAPEPVPQSEETTPAPVKEEVAPEESTPAPVEEEEETTTAPVGEGGKPEESTPVLVEDEDESSREPDFAPVGVEETEVPAVPEEPTPAPPTEPEPVPAPVAVEEPVSTPTQAPEEVATPANQEPAAVPVPSSEPAPVPVPEAKAEVAAVQVPAAEPTAVSSAPAAEPTPVVEAAAPKASEVVAPKAPAAAPEPTPQVAAVEPPVINGHSKTLSGVSTSSATASLPSTPARKASRKFSFPGRGKDKSANSSPTGSSRFASQEKRDKRHSLLGKLKEIFSDKGKKEKSEAKA